MPRQNRGTSGAQEECCNVCFRFVVTGGFAALFLWLALRTHPPTVSIEQFHVFALNPTSDRNPNSSVAASNRTIYFDLKLKNRNQDKGVFYDALRLTFSYKLNWSLPVASTTFPAFYQGHDKSACRRLEIEAAQGKWLTAAEAAVGANGSAVFRVDLATAVRYKVVFWKTKKKRLERRGDLTVNGQGMLVRGEKGVKLNSGPGIGPPCYRALGFFIIVSCLGILRF